MTASPQSKVELWAFIDDLANQLDERQRGPRAQIARIVKRAGIAFSQEMFQLTLETEAQGGLMLPDGSRRRTRGGVFFYLVRTRLSDELRQEIFSARNKQKKARRNLPSSAPVLPAFVWEERAAIIEKLMVQPGTVSSLKVVLRGRPERLEQRQAYVILWLADRLDHVTLPKGVPTPPSRTILYKVYLAVKYWQRLEKALANPEDQLIIEGMTAFDMEGQEILVFATQATSKLIEAQRRAERRSLQA